MNPAFEKNTIKINCEFFDLAFEQFSTQTDIFMNLKTSKYMTGFYPNTIAILEKNLPSIMFSNCYNPLNLPFKEEVKNTETAHLFEHIVITHLYEYKSNAGIKNAKYDGLTSWKISSPLNYKITINVGKNESFIFIKSLRESIKVLESIISQKQVDIVLPVSMSV